MQQQSYIGKNLEEIRKDIVKFTKENKILGYREDVLKTTSGFEVTITWNEF